MDEVEDTGFLSAGQRLREAREAAGMTLEEIATSTRIPTRHLESLETGDYSRLPAPTYSIGFAKNYATAVGLDRDAIGDQIRAELGGTRPATAVPSDVFEPADPARAMPRWLIFAALAAIIVAVLAFTWLGNRTADPVGDEVVIDNLLANGDAPVPSDPGAPIATAQGPVLITANEAAWIEVSDGGAILRQGELAAGQSFEVPANAVAPVLTTGKPEALRISVGTADAPPVGPAGQRVSGVSLRAADLLRPRPATAPATPATTNDSGPATPAQ